ncbi:MAG: TonB-dependent receptor plug domain-containing protein, partial [Bacteroidota bacterium]
MKRIAIILFLWLVPAVLLAQTVTGTVVDADSRDPIIGARILVDGTSRGAVSGEGGQFEVQASLGDTLLVSYLGYRERKIGISESVMQIRLSQDEFSLDEVLVTGYGTQAVKDLTGSVASISSKDFNQGNMVTPENLLNGRVAGVSITTGGAPGSGSTIRIRGGASLDASNDPLIVINGLPISNNAVGGSRSILSTINPNDIASFTILKDASATAIYGSRASNGVILITTKSGSQNLSVQFNSQLGYSSLVDKIDVFTGDEFRELVATQRPDLVELLGDANTDWQEEIYQDAVFQNHSLAVQGSLFKVLPVRLSLGLTDQPGLRLTSQFQRKTASLNLTPSYFEDHLKVSVNANVTQEDNRFAPGQEGNAISFDPTQPVYQEGSPFGGFFEYYKDNNDGAFNSSDLISNSPGNPVAALLQRNDQSTVYRLYGNTKIDYRLPFLPSLRAVVNLGLDDASATGFIEIDSASRVTQPNGEFVGSYSQYTNDQRNVLFDGYLAYEEQFDQLRVDLTGGYSYQKFESASYVSGEQRNDLPDTEPVS